MCFACLLLGVGAGHAVREGSAYAATMGGSSIAARVPSGVAGNQSRDTHVVSSARAVAHGSARGKDVSVITTRAAARPARLARPVRPAPVRPAGTAEADALFIDFEPTFRVDR